MIKFAWEKFTCLAVSADGCFINEERWNVVFGGGSKFELLNIFIAIFHSIFFAGKLWENGSKFKDDGNYPVL